MIHRPCLTITMGDPAGIGPLVTFAALDKLGELTSSHRAIVIGSQRSLIEAAERSGGVWRGTVLSERELRDDATAPHPGEIGVVEPPGAAEAIHRPAIPTSDGGRLQVAAIDIAMALAKAGRAQAIVTGPVSKIAITRASIHFTGHTEYLARAAGIAPDQVTMMFAGTKLKVALVTTHLPISHVAAALTKKRITSTIERVIMALRNQWQIAHPCVVVLGLNPHAGEEGLLGEEEERVIAPSVEQARSKCDDCTIDGPLPSEVGLRRTIAGDYDCAIAHYHDQATIASKLVEMGQAVNVTLGLPFVRTSVDHGVAYDAALTGDADPSSMMAALKLAATLIHPERSTC